ncbi:MAG: histidine kinase [Bacteroidota bacterium]
MELHSRYLFLFLLLFCTGTWVSAQHKSHKAVELKKKGEATNSNSRLSKKADQVDVLLNRAEQISAQEPKKALDYIAEALALSINENNARGEAQTYQTLGNINYEQGLFAKAVENYRKCMEGFSALGDASARYEARRKLAAALEANGETANALAQWNEVLQEATTSARLEDKVQAKTSIGRLYEKQGKEELALKSYKEVLKIEEKRGNDKGVISTNNSIGDIYLQQEKPQQARAYYDNSQSLASGMSDDNTLAKSNDMLGKVLRLEKRYDQELALRQQSIAINLKSNNKTALNDEYLEVAHLYLEQKNAAAAIPYLQKSITLSGQLDKLDKKSEGYRSLSEAYVALGKVKDALKSYQTYVALVEGVYKKRETELAGLLQFKEELSERQKKIESLEKDRQLNAKTIELLRKDQKLREEGMQKQLILIYALVVGLLLVFVASYLLYKSAQKRRIANQLLALKSLRSQMNPHFIFNALNSVNSFISQNDERSANKYLSEFSRLMRAVMENSQHNFIPLSNELKILELYLNLEHFRFKEKFDYTFEVDPAIDIDSIQMPPMLIQPYIENAVWHGLRYKEEKGLLTVKVKKDTDDLVVCIEDNGIGRKKSQAIKTSNQKENVSTGLLNIENRLRIINEIHRTKLSVSITDLHTTDESGTKVIIRIPLHIHEVTV